MAADVETYRQKLGGERETKLEISIRSLLSEPVKTHGRGRKNYRSQSSLGHQENTTHKIN